MVTRKQYNSLKELEIAQNELKSQFHSVEEDIKNIFKQPTSKNLGILNSIAPLLGGSSKKSVINTAMSLVNSNFHSAKGITSAFEVAKAVTTNPLFVKALKFTGSSVIKWQLVSLSLTAGKILCKKISENRRKNKAKKLANKILMNT